jgi:hypothetical protein
MKYLCETEVLTAVNVFWDATACSLVQRCQRLEGCCCTLLHSTHFQSNVKYENMLIPRRIRGSRSDGYTMGWDTTPCSPLKVNLRFGGTYCFHLQGLRISRVWIQRESRLCFPPVFPLTACLAYSSTLKMEATRSSKTSVDFQTTTWRYNPEVRTLHAYNTCSVFLSTNSLLLCVYYRACHHLNKELRCKG